MKIFDKWIPQESTRFEAVFKWKFRIFAVVSEVKIEYFSKKIFNFYKTIL